MHLLPSLVVVVTLGGDGQCPCSAPVSPLQIGSKACWHGVLAGQLTRKLSLVYLCPFHYKEPRLWLPVTSSSPCPQRFFLQKQLCMKAPGEAAGSFRFRVLVQHPCPRLLAEMPPTTNSSEGVSPGMPGSQAKINSFRPQPCRGASGSHSPAVKWAQGGDVKKEKLSN